MTIVASLQGPLRQFLDSHLCYAASARPNTVVRFPIVDTTKKPLGNSPSPLNRIAWKALLYEYPDSELPQIIDDILLFGALIGYDGPTICRISDNLSNAHEYPELLTTKIRTDLENGLVRKIELEPGEPFVASPLGFAPKPKPNGDRRQIHHLSYPRGESVNDYIDETFAYLKYVAFRQVLSMVLLAGRGCIVLKRDMSNAFRIIPIAPHIQWLLGFRWQGTNYVHTVLPFGLSTAPFIFNLLAEAFEWILRSYLGWNIMAHYLDDTFNMIKATRASEVDKEAQEYKTLTDILGIPRNDSKDGEGTKIELLGLLVDTVTFKASVPPEKMRKIQDQAMKLGGRKSVTKKEVEELTGLLSFCAPVVQLGWVFCRNFWTFLQQWPLHVSPTKRRRMPAEVKADLAWWAYMLPRFDGIHFFDQNREFVHLFADASEEGLGAFFIEQNSPTCNWEQHASLMPPEHALACQLPAQEKESPFDINIFEIQAVLRAFEHWGEKWRGKKVVIHTDNTTTQIGLIKQTLRCRHQNKPLRHILCLAAHGDIEIEAQRIPGIDNGLADALSRKLIDKIADWCPQWFREQSDSTIRLLNSLNIQSRKSAFQKNAQNYYTTD